MVRDYKHIHHTDMQQVNINDSDAGYSTYLITSEMGDNDESPKELLTGLEVPKRKISDQFRCPVCKKVYLGTARMANHFKQQPDHGSMDMLQALPESSPEIKSPIGQDPLKKKGKKRGPWAYATPEAKSERRQEKLQAAISICENNEIIKVAAKPVVNAGSMFDLMLLKCDSNVGTFLVELAGLMQKIHEQASTMLIPVVDGENHDSDIINLNDKALCATLGLLPGFYKINNEAFKKSEDNDSPEEDDEMEEPDIKKQRVHNDDVCDGIMESSDNSDYSGTSVPDFLIKRKSNCPEVLSALTLMPRNHATVAKSSSVSKLLISNPDIQNQISENPGFRKINITSKTQSKSFAKFINFTDLETSFEDTEGGTSQQAFMKLQPMEQSFKLENSTVSTYEEQDMQNCDEGVEKCENLEETGSPSFVKGFHKLISTIVPVTETDEMSLETDGSTDKMLDNNTECPNSELSDEENTSEMILPDTVPTINNSSTLFDSTDNLDITNISIHDQAQRLHISLTTNDDMNHVEQLQLDDQSNLVDDLVTERLNNFLPHNILSLNMISNGTNLGTVLDFDELSEEFNRNTNS